MAFWGLWLKMKKNDKWQVNDRYLLTLENILSCNNLNFSFWDEGIIVLLFCSYYTWATLTYESLGKKFQRNPTGVSEIKSIRSHAMHKKGVMRSLLIKGIFYCTWWASGCIYWHKVREYLPELQKKWNVHLEARAMNSTDKALHCHYMQNDEWVPQYWSLLHREGLPSGQ